MAEALLPNIKRSRSAGPRAMQSYIQQDLYEESREIPIQRGNRPALDPPEKVRWPSMPRHSGACSPLSCGSDEVDDIDPNQLQSSSDSEANSDSENGQPGDHNNNRKNNNNNNENSRKVNKNNRTSTRERKNAKREGNLSSKQRAASSSNSTRRERDSSSSSSDSASDEGSDDSEAETSERTTAAKSSPSKKAIEKADTKKTSTSNVEISSEDECEDECDVDIVKELYDELDLSSSEVMMPGMPAVDVHVLEQKLRETASTKQDRRKKIPTPTDNDEDSTDEVDDLIDAIDDLIEADDEDIVYEASTANKQAKRQKSFKSSVGLVMNAGKLSKR